MSCEWMQTVHEFSWTPCNPMIQENSRGRVRFLAIGDPHFKLSTTSIMDTFIERVTHVVQEICPDYIIVLGDVLNDFEKVHSGVMNQACRFLESIATYCPTYVLVGNHDYINNSQFLSTHHWMNALKPWPRLTIVDTGHVLDLQDRGKFLFVPYVASGRFQEALDTIDPDWRHARVIFAHQEITGVKMGAIVSESTDNWEETWPFLVSGHIHDKQHHRPNVYYPGSSIQHAFGDNAVKTLAMCDVQEDGVHVSCITLGMPRRITKRIDVEQFEALALPTDTQDLFRVVVDATHEDFARLSKTKQFKALAAQGVVFKCHQRTATPVLDTTANGNEGEDRTRRRGFEDILWDLVEATGDPRLARLFRRIVPEATNRQ